ncbi:hypothetical protein LMG918_19090 [Xanthomonas euvesicatoria]|nr:hypothetical protein LMG918_19090 [Xanthomonas euvesicatoria]
MGGAPDALRARFIGLQFDARRSSRPDGQRLRQPGLLAQRRYCVLWHAGEQQCRSCLTVQKRQRQPYWLPLEVRMHSAVDQCAPKRQFNSSM